MNEKIKYKVGDRVRILPKEGDVFDYPCDYLPCMDQYSGKVLTIKEICIGPFSDKYKTRKYYNGDDNVYKLSMDEKLINWYFHSSMFEPMKEYKEIMKYKVGDKVKVIKREGNEDDYPCSYVDEMMGYAYRMATITEIVEDDVDNDEKTYKYYNGDNNSYRLLFDGEDGYMKNNFFWHSSMFEPIKKESKKDKEKEVVNYKVGDIVEIIPYEYVEYPIAYTYSMEQCVGFKAKIKYIGSLFGSNLDYAKKSSKYNGDPHFYQLDMILPSGEISPSKYNWHSSMFKRVSCNEKPSTPVYKVGDRIRIVKKDNKIDYPFGFPTEMASYEGCVFEISKVEEFTEDWDKYAYKRCINTNGDIHKYTLKRIKGEDYTVPSIVLKPEIFVWHSSMFEPIKNEVKTMTHKYKVGDVVIINHRIHNSQDYPYSFTDEMTRYEGVKCRITRTIETDFNTQKSRKLYNGDDHWYHLAPVDNNYNDRGVIVGSIWHSTMFSPCDVVEEKKEEKPYLLGYDSCLLGYGGKVVKSRKDRWYFKPKDEKFWSRFNDHIIGTTFCPISQEVLNGKINSILCAIGYGKDKIQNVSYSGGHKSLPTFSSKEDCLLFIEKMNNMFNDLDDFRYKIETGKIKDAIKEFCNSEEKTTETVKKTEESFNIKEIGSKIENIFSRTIEDKKEGSRGFVSGLLSLKL